QRAARWAGITNAAEALRHLKRVRSLVGMVPHSTEAVQLGATACWNSLELGWRLGIPATEAASIFEERGQLAEESRDVRTLAAMHGAYAVVLRLVCGYSDDSVRYCREATRLAAQSGDKGLQLTNHSNLAFACGVYAGRLAEAIEACNKAWERLPADP